MKVKPYRICDICKKQYEKTHGCMKIKRFYDKYGICDTYGDWKIMTPMDICPECSERLIRNVLYEIQEERGTK